MTNTNPTIEQYIEHEVKIRVLESKHDEIHKEFDKIDHRLDRLESKFEMGFIMLVGLIITSIVLPVVLHSLKLVWGYKCITYLTFCVLLIALC